jgi:intermediate filament protein if
MNAELQRITRDLDHETIARVELENCKQTLEDEIHFLKKIHMEEIEELKQMNTIGTSLDPTKFFKNELINAVQQIREEYEQLNDQQRTELQTWYQMKVTQAVRWSVCVCVR